MCNFFYKNYLNNLIKYLKNSLIPPEINISKYI